MKPLHKAIREMSYENCLELLGKKTFCHLGCTDGREAYVVPMSYAFDDGMIYCHSREGKKLEFLRKYLISCVQVEEVEDFYNWKSVTAFCEFEELQDEEAIRSARMIINQLRHFDKIPPLEEDFSAMMETSVLFRLKIRSLTGRFEIID